MKKVKQERTLAFKMILFIFSSTALIFSVIFPYYYFISKKIVEKNLKHSARNLTLATVANIEEVLSAVQKIPDNFSKLIEDSDLSKEEVIKLLQHAVEQNPEIFGATLAFEPEFFEKGQKYFAPYFYRSSGEVKFQFIGGSNYDYFTMDWYQVPKELNRPIWSEPFFDEGAGNIVMSTYSVPLYRNQNGVKTFFGILTADLSLDWMRTQMDAIKVLETGYGFLISSNGKLVSHPIESMIMNETIFSIGAFHPFFKIPAKYPHEVYALGRNCSWGWGVWKNSWKKIN